MCSQVFPTSAATAAASCRLCTFSGWGGTLGVSPRRSSFATVLC